MHNRGSADEPRPALPPAATNCLRRCSSADRVRGETLRARSQGEHSRNQKRRTRRLRVLSARVSARANDLAWEAR